MTHQTKLSSLNWQLGHRRRQVGQSTWVGVKRGLVWLVQGNFTVRMEGEGTSAKHTGSKIAHHRFGLDVEVAKHFVGPPTANEADQIGVYLGTEKGHGPGCAQ